MMTKTASRKTFYPIAALTLLAPCVIGLIGFGTEASPTPAGARSGQDALTRAERMVKSSRRNKVVKITKLKVRGGPVEFDRKFHSDDDWLKGLTITVENISDKPIVFMLATLELFGDGDRVGESHVPVQFPLTYGSEPGADAPELSHRPEAVKSGDSVDITLSDSEYAYLLESLTRDNYPTRFKQVKVMVEEVIFGDGMMWHKGSYFFRDPGNPTRWVRDKYLQKGGRSERELRPRGGDVKI